MTDLLRHVLNGKIYILNILNTENLRKHKQIVSLKIFIISATAKAVGGKHACLIFVISQTSLRSVLAP